RPHQSSNLLQKAGEGTRTPSLPLTRRLLYQLSYSGPWGESKTPGGRLGDGHGSRLEVAMAV
ncbi:MAG: hypothetical protein QOK25_1287, partial [Thermoleophilaceae bacterium]|nr:hypothetical protein [Thermoleophilaceae bacterium]